MMAGQSAAGETGMPQAIGRYQIRSMLATGPIEDIYKGFDPIIERPVMVKVFRLPTEDPETERALTATFYRQMPRTGVLTHHGIAALFDAGAVPGGLFIATEFVDGCHLTALLARGEALELALRASLITQIVDALEYARQANVPHLSLKPSSVIVGSDYTLKLAGFGAAPVVDALLAAAGIRRPSPYMSPERQRGEQGDTRSDVFSLAQLALDVFAAVPGEHPSAGEVPELPASLSAEGVNADAWRAVFARALAVDPATRFATPGAFQMDLLLAIGVGETEAQLAWATSRAMAEVALNAKQQDEEFQTVLSPVGPPPAVPGPPPRPGPVVALPDSDTFSDDAETLLTPMPEPSRRSGGHHDGLRAGERSADPPDSGKPGSR